MNQQAQTRKAQPGQGKHQPVGGYCRIGMEGMEANAAAEGIKDGIGLEMIEVDQHRQQHDQGKLFPAIGKGKSGQHNRRNDMEDEVNGQPGHVETTHATGTVATFFLIQPNNSRVEMTCTPFSRRVCSAAAALPAGTSTPAIASSTTST